jgi:hypothetical protein
MKKPIILVTALAMWAGVAVAQTENDILRANSRGERHLNSVWNDTLTPSMRDALRVEERNGSLGRIPSHLTRKAGPALTGAIICGNMPASISNHSIDQRLDSVRLVSAASDSIVKRLSDTP